MVLARMNDVKKLDTETPTTISETIAIRKVSDIRECGESRKKPQG